MIRLHKIYATAINEYPVATAWNPSDNRLAVALAGGEVFLKAFADPDTVPSLNAHQIGCTKLAWLDDVRLATGGQDGKLNVWDVRSGQCLWCQPVCGENHRAWVENLIFHPKTQKLVVSAGKSLKVFDADLNLNHHFTCHDSTVTSISFSDDGTQLAAAYYGGVNIYTFRADDEYEMVVMPYPISFVSLAMSPNGRFVAAGTQDKRLHFWLLPYEEGEDLEMAGYPKKIELLSWIPDSTYVLTASQRMIISWKMRTEISSPHGSRPLMLDDHQAPVTQLVCQKKGILTASGDSEGRLIIWDYPKSEYVQTEWEIKGSITSLCWSNDEKKIAVTSQKGEIIVLAI